MAFSPASREAHTSADRSETLGVRNRRRSPVPTGKRGHSRCLPRRPPDQVQRQRSRGLIRADRIGRTDILDATMLTAVEGTRWSPPSGKRRQPRRCSGAIASGYVARPWDDVVVSESGLSEGAVPGGESSASERLEARLLRWDDDIRRSAAAGDAPSRLISVLTLLANAPGRSGTRSPMSLKRSGFGAVRNPMNVSESPTTQRTCPRREAGQESA
jgi:hypothetical protein